MMQEWLNKVIKLEGGRFTVWDREVKEAVKNLYNRVGDQKFIQQINMQNQNNLKF